MADNRNVKPASPDYISMNRSCSEPQTLFCGTPFNSTSQTHNDGCCWQSKQKPIVGGGVDMAMQSQTHLLQRDDMPHVGVL